MVRLKAAAFSSATLLTLQRFNSNMVRLKDFGGYIISITINEFQFQYGSIKSIILIALKKIGLPVSIPIWFD